DETLAELFVVELLLEQLDRHQPIDTWIARQQNLAHPALGEPPEHLKPADVLWRFSHYRPATIAWTSRGLCNKEQRGLRGLSFCAPPRCRPSPHRSVIRSRARATSSTPTSARRSPTRTAGWKT